MQYYWYITKVMIAKYAKDLKTNLQLFQDNDQLHCAITKDIQPSLNHNPSPNLTLYFFCQKC